MAVDYKYLTPEDLNVYIRPDVLDAISDSSNANKISAEADAMAKVRSYLKNRYLIDEEFLKTGENRNRNTIRCTAIIMIYTLYISVSTHQVPEEIGRLYDECIKWLDMVRKGDLDPGLDPLPPEEIEDQWDGVLGDRNDFESYY